MKKTIVAGLVLLALIVIVSPGLVGKLAEQSMDRQMHWAADENRQIEVTSSGFDRSWFSSAGTHRVVFASTPAGAALRDQLGFDPDGPGPALIIETTLDHGIVPVTSMQRENGSLAPGLGRAVSTLSLEAPDGTVSELPGVVYTNVGLAGGVNSRYELEPGSAGDVTWGAIDFSTEMNTRQTTLDFDGQLQSLEMRDGGESMLALGPTTMNGKLKKTPWDFRVGDIAVEIESMAASAGGQTIEFAEFAIDSDSRLAGERVNSTFDIRMALEDVPQQGPVAITMRGSVENLHGPSLGLLNQRLEAAQDIEDPVLMLGAIDRELKGLLAHGLGFEFEDFDVALADGTLSTALAMTLAETVPDEFTWASVLLALEASSDIRIPSALFEKLASQNPNAQSAVAMGFLQRDGDDYVMNAEYAKGLLTVNGAPMPIPIPSM